jgi:hypothetical protein
MQHFIAEIMALSCVPSHLIALLPATGCSSDWAIQNASGTKTNPGRIISIQNLPRIIRYASGLTFTQANITASFKKTGVWPPDTTVFIDEDFCNFYHDRQAIKRT